MSVGWIYEMPGQSKQDRQFTLNAKSRRLRAIIVAVEKQ